MPWNGGENGGFTAGTPWIPLHSRYREINVEKDLASRRSVYRFYQKLLRLRSAHAAFLDGVVQVLSAPEDDCFVFTRSAGSETWAVICNFENPRQISLPFPCDPPALANLGRKTAEGVYAPYECAAAKARL